MGIGYEYEVTELISKNTMDGSAKVSKKIRQMPPPPQRHFKSANGHVNDLFTQKKIRTLAIFDVTHFNSQ